MIVMGIELTKKNKVIIQTLFWIVYYITFSFIWVKDGNYKASFFLEFVLLPIRILTVYFCVLFLIPKYLIHKRLKEFILYYIGMLILASIAQRLFMYFFFEDFNKFVFTEIFNISAMLRSLILINTTVIFVSSIYILLLYFREKNKNEQANSKMIELKSNRRTHIISTNSIIYIEGLGNYVNYHLSDASKITVYQSLKQCLLQLEDENFTRIQKSFIININYLRSYDNDTVEMNNGISLPIGAKFNIKELSIHHI
ncbi:LytTR family transcriptional regulator [Aquimarina sp. AD10]|uniref:HTH LytTR-type domain-containing protein n=2 Tax=Flavobacteriaceae TaxID=49546 RepID=A0A162CTQ1_9FLAO|nr:LytTR family transcriptional regulator [Aquimarina sp. AD10]KZS40879.1 hypothetical protein AWE51_24715 [Aquimarina aggregata]RKM98467.1 LytTR family transcriptional regulator [Aquimarina sp. AD10]